MGNSNTNADAYKKAYLRQRQARERAEELLEFRSRELYDSNQSLIDANRQLAEQQAQLVAQEKLAAKSEFLSMMSHEIKTPLNAIISMAFILKEMEMEADAVEALEILSRSSEHLRTLIMNLLDFSKFEAKGEELNERDCSLFKLLGDVREMCKTNLNEGVAYEHKIADDVPDRIKLDAALGDSGHGGGVIERRRRRRPGPRGLAARQVESRSPSSQRVLDARPLVAHVKRGPVHEGGVEREPHHLVGVERATRNSGSAQGHRRHGREALAASQ